MHQRTAIKNYFVDMLKASVAVGGRVVANRSDAMLLEELPAVIVTFSGEAIEVLDGDANNPAFYKRTITADIDVVTTEGEDETDEYCYQIERAIFEDNKLAKRLPTYANDGNVTNGLSYGVTLKSCVPYTESSEGEIATYGSRITVEIPYECDATTLDKLNYFDTYSAEITKQDPNAVDPVLAGMQGDTTT